MSAPRLHEEDQLARVSDLQDERPNLQQITVVQPSGANSSPATCPPSTTDQLAKGQAFCEQHSTKGHPIDLDHFCVDCSVLVCYKCARSSQHGKHTVRYQDRDVLSQLAQSLQDTANEVASKASLAQREIASKQDALEKSCEDTVDAINTSYKTKLSILEKRKNDLISTVDEFTRSKIEGIKKSLRKLEEAKQAVNEVTRVTEQALRAADFSFLAKEESLRQELKNHQQIIEEVSNVLSENGGNLNVIFKFEEGKSIDHALCTYGHFTECQYDDIHNQHLPQVIRFFIVDENGKVCIMSVPHSPLLRNQAGMGESMDTDAYVVPFLPMFEYSYPYASQLPGMQRVMTWGDRVSPLVTVDDVNEDNESVSSHAESRCTGVATPSRSPSSDSLQTGQSLSSCSSAASTTYVAPTALDLTPKPATEHASEPPCSPEPIINSSEQITNYTDEEHGQLTYMNLLLCEDFRTQPSPPMRAPVYATTNRRVQQPQSPTSISTNSPPAISSPQQEQESPPSLPPARDKSTPHYTGCIYTSVEETECTSNTGSEEASDDYCGMCDVSRASQGSPVPPPVPPMAPDALSDDVSLERRESPQSSIASLLSKPTSPHPGDLGGGLAAVEGYEKCDDVVPYIPMGLAPPNQEFPPGRSTLPVAASLMPAAVSAPNFSEHVRCSFTQSLDSLHRPLPHPLPRPIKACYRAEQQKEPEQPESAHLLPADQPDANVYEYIPQATSFSGQVHQIKRGIGYIHTQECAAYGRATSSNRHQLLPTMSMPPVRPLNRVRLTMTKPIKVINSDQFRPESAVDVFPCGVCCTDRYNNIIITDVANHCVRVVDENGSFVTKFGERGSTNGCFSLPVAIATSHGNFHYIADQQNARIQKFTADGSFVLKFGKKSSRQILKKPEGLTIRRETGDVYVADSEKKRVYVYQSDGTYLRPIGKPKQAIQFSCPVGVAITKTDCLLVLDRSPPNSHCVWSIRQPKEELDKKIGEGILENPSGIAVTDDGTILVTELENDSVCVFSKKGEPLCRFGQTGVEPGMFSQPCGIFVSKEGHVVVADKGNNRVQVFLLEDILRRL